MNTRAGAAQQQEEEDEEVVVDGGKTGEQEDGSYIVDPAELVDRDTKKGGEQRKKDGEGDEDLGIDARSALEADGDANEEVRKRRREERKRREEARRAREEEKDERIARLEGTVSTLLGDRSAQQEGNLRQAYEDAEAEKRRLVSTYEEAKALKEKAFKDQDAKGIVDADEIMQNARERFASLSQQQNRILSVAKERENRQQQQVHPNVEQGAKKFMKDNPWYDPAGGDRQSARTLAIDKQMFREGWDPRTPGYWEELQARVEDEGLGGKKGQRREREERDDDEREERGQRRRQYTGSGGGHGGGEGGAVRIPAAYVANLKEAGMWEDPAQRKKMIKKYIDSQKRK